MDWAALRDQLGRSIRCSELSERQPSGTARADSDQPIGALGIVLALVTALADSEDAPWTVRAACAERGRL